MRVPVAANTSSRFVSSCQVRIAAMDDAGNFLEIKAVLNIRGYSPFHAALFMLPISISAFVAGSLNGFVLHKVGVGRALWTSLIVSATGLMDYAVFRNSSAVEQVAS